MAHPITDISQLSPEVIEQLRSTFQGVPDPTQRSPIRKVLTDLREPSNPKDRLNRPSFFWSADESMSDKRPYVLKHYPKLKFKLDDAGKLAETVVLNEHSEATLGSEWSDAPPFLPPTTAQDRLKAELAELSDEDRAFVLEAQRKARLERLMGSLSNLSDTALADVSGSAMPVKRGPGRPRKASADGA